MSDEPQTTRIFISAAEQSADEHAAGLIRAAGEQIGNVSFVGLAGPAMQDAGCEAIHDMTTRSAMAGAVVWRIPEAIGVLRSVKRLLSSNRFDAAVVVDSPTLNLPIARLCRQFAVPVLYYIAPQTWAWAEWRNRRIRRRVDRMACIWPFEESYFRSFGIPARYVGHPSFDRFIAHPGDDAEVARLRRTQGPLITILPGSRRHVVREVLPGQLEVARSLAARFKNARFLIVPANAEVRVLIRDLVGQCGADLRISYSDGPQGRATAIRAATLVLVASGTVTLEVAYHATPMIVMYNANRWLYRLLGRWLISTPHLAIPNILAGRRIVPEFMPYYKSVDPIIAQASEWISTPSSLARVRAELRAAVDPIVKPGAAASAARELSGLLRDRGRHASFPL
ncbi:MAG: lipid-A-disaccharide synthase [Phycisphaerae bacterium]